MICPTPRSFATTGSLLAGIALVLASCAGRVDGGSKSDPTTDPTTDPDPSTMCAVTHTFAIPFDYTIESGLFSINTEGGPLRVVIGPWGAHTQPHTGHMEGNGKSDWAGLFAATWDDPVMADLSGGTPVPGGCTPNGICGVNIDDVTNRIPYYIAPVDGFEITDVILSSVDVGNEYDSHHWEVQGTLCPYGYRFGHVGTIGADLRQALMDLGYDDPSTLDTPKVLFQDRDNPIVLDAGATIAAPQIRWSELSSPAGYLKGWGSVEATPWAQIEFSVNDSTNDLWSARWNLMTPQLRDQMQQVLDVEGLRPNSLRYGQVFAVDWLWQSEMVLEATEAFSDDDPPGLFTHFGGWWEIPSGTCQPNVDPGCDQQLSIFPIHRESMFYDASLYASANVSNLVGLGGPQAVGNEMWGEVVSPKQPDSTAGVMTIKWRYPLASPSYEYISYRVLSSNTLVMHFGATADTINNLPSKPAIPADDSVCDGDTIVCFNHDFNFGQ